MEGLLTERVTRDLHAAQRAANEVQKCGGAVEVGPHRGEPQVPGVKDRVLFTGLCRVGAKSRFYSTRCEGCPGKSQLLRFDFVVYIRGQGQDGSLDSRKRFWDVSKIEVQVHGSSLHHQPFLIFIELYLRAFGTAIAPRTTPTYAETARATGSTGLASSPIIRPVFSQPRVCGANKPFTGRSPCPSGRRQSSIITG